MSTTRNASEKLPGRFEDLVLLMVPQALMDDVHHENTVLRKLKDRFGVRPEVFMA